VSELNVQIDGATKELVIRNGNAKVLKEPTKIIIDGDIRSVSSFLAKRKNQSIVGQFSNELTNEFHVDQQANNSCCPGLQRVKPCRSIVIVDKEAGTIQLQLDPENFYGAIVTGKLEESKELGIFQINEAGATFSRESVIQLIRFNKRFFVDHTQHATLLQAFQKFSAKVYTELEKESDTRGNASGLFKKTVNSNIPLAFAFRIPIYKGQPPVTFTVEIGIESDRGVTFYFESAELAELMEIKKDEIINAELQSCEDYPIIYK
jgi:hypothetical protein